MEIDKFTLSPSIVKATQECKEIVASLVSRYPIDVCLKADVVVSGVGRHYKSSTITVHEYKPEMLELFEDEILNQVLGDMIFDESTGAISNPMKYMRTTLEVRL